MADSSSLHAAEHTAPNPFVGEFGEPSLDQIDPGAVGGREVHMEARALGEPVPDDRRLVSAVVIQDEMNVQIGRHLGLDHIQELAELHRAMAPVELADDPAGLQVQRGKQGSRPVAFVVVRAALHCPGCMGSSGWVRSSA